MHSTNFGYDDAYNDREWWTLKRVALASCRRECN